MTLPVRRRSLLQLSAFGLMAGLAPVARAAAPEASQTQRLRHPPARARSCILLYMDGGPSHIDLLDLKPQAPAEIRGPYQPIATSVPGIAVCEHLPRLARQMHLVWQIRSLHHQQGVHDPAVYQMLTGYPHVSSAGGLEVEETDLPHMACGLEQALRDPSLSDPSIMPRIVETPQRMTMGGRVLPGQHAGLLGRSFDPLQVEVTREGAAIAPDFARGADVSLDRLARRGELLRAVDRAERLAGDLSGVDSGPRTFTAFQEQALRIAGSPDVQSAFDLERESLSTRELYGRHRHGQSVLLARRLVEAGARFVTVYWGNEDQDWADGRGARLANNPWDTHRNHFPLTSDSLCPRADQALAALLADLAQRGLLDDTLVVWAGDFGRTPRISKPWASRDHWPHAFTVLMAGAGLPGGTTYGATDGHAAYVTENGVTPADLTATIYSLLGVDPKFETLGLDGIRRPLSTGRAITTV